MAHRHTEDVWLDIVETESQLYVAGRAERADLAVRLFQLEREYALAVDHMILNEEAGALIKLPFRAELRALRPVGFA